MEFLETVGLNFLIDTRSKQLAGNELRLLLQAAEGLAYLHSKGYIHRDVCPRNMLVNSESVLKLIDFGLTVPNRPEFRKPGNRTGTANYMAPELIRRAPTDERIDVFSFAVTAYETFTGGLPWEATESLQSILQHLNWPGRDPRDLKPDLDERIAQMLLKGIERDPSLRYRNMTEFAAELRRLCDELAPVAK
jgi:serine/threonine protein kinase